MQSMHSTASYMDFDFKLLHQCGSQTKPLGSLRWNLQVEGMNSTDPGVMWEMHQPFSTVL